MKYKPYVTKFGSEHEVALLHITHPDDDHVRNAKRVKEELNPYLLRRQRYECYPDKEHINEDYVDTLCERYRYTCSEEIDWGFDINEVCYIPVKTCESDSTLNAKVRNNSSIIRYIKEDGIGILFCGDLETRGWERLVSDEPNFFAMLKREGVNVLIAPHHGHKSAFPKALFDEIGCVEVVIHSKGTEANKDGTDVACQYSAYAWGVPYTVLRDENACYEGKVLTTRSNGNIFIDTVPGTRGVWTDKASPNHCKG